MGQIKWYKRDPSAALTGMMELTLEERGAYNTVLDLIYTRDGNLPDEDRFIAGWLNSDVRVWRRIKSRLIAAGKLYLADGLIRNGRADVEVLSALSRVGSAREAGLASARSKATKSSNDCNKNNDIEETVVETPVATPVSTNHNHNHKEDKRPYGLSSFGTCQNDTQPALIDDPPEEPEKPLTIEEVVEDWNALAAALDLPIVRKITEQRRRAFKVRLRQYPDIEDWARAFSHIRNTPFLRGEGRSGWKADFDFVLQAKSFTRLTEEAYDHG